MNVTKLNLEVLARVMDGKSRVPNQMGAPSVPHIRRCFKAGLVAVEGPRQASELVITPAGREALATLGVSLAGIRRGRRCVC